MHTHPQSTRIHPSTNTSTRTHSATHTDTQRHCERLKWSLAFNWMRTGPAWSYEGQPVSPSTLPFYYPVFCPSYSSSSSPPPLQFSLSSASFLSFSSSSSSFFLSSSPGHAKILQIHYAVALAWRLSPRLILILKCVPERERIGEKEERGREPLCIILINT